MNNTCYIYNDTFISLLTLINYLLKFNIKPFSIRNTLYNPSLLDEVITLNLKDEEKLILEIKNNYGIYSFKCMYYTFLSCEENKELIIYYFFLNCLKYKQKIIYMRNLKCVNKSLKITNYVAHEVHKYKGFVRFRELENKILYAEIEPTNDVLYLVSYHFQRRLKNEYWIIKDVKRGILSIYDKNKFYIIEEQNFQIATNIISYKEEQIKELWISFYQTIGIKERKNERCRMNFLPKKYWKYLTEMESEL